MCNTEQLLDGELVITTTTTTIILGSALYNSSYKIFRGNIGELRHRYMKNGPCLESL